MTLVNKIGYITLIFWGCQISTRILFKLYKIFFSTKKPIDFSKLGKWAMVTGCSYGIGKAFAEVLAKKGFNIILVSVNSSEKSSQNDLIKNLSQQLENIHQVKTKILNLNLAAGLDSYKFIETEILGLEIGVLVNNFGQNYPHPEYFLDLPHNDKIYMNLINCNIVVTTNMCRIILPQMILRRKGIIINVASSAAVIPSPLLTVYAATKAYILKFISGVRKSSSSDKMDSRSFNNPYEDYSEDKQNLFFTSEGNNLNDKFKKTLNDGTQNLWQRLEHYKRYWHRLDDSSIYTGLPGIAYTYYLYGINFEDKSSISKALEFISESVEGLKEKKITFLTGTSGPFALAAVMHHTHGDKEESKQMLSKLKSLSLFVLDEGSHLPDELLYGSAGYLFSLLFVNKYIFPAPIEKELIQEIINHMLNSGKNYVRAHRINSPLMYSWHESEYLGGAHGLAGILYLLLQAREYLSEDQLNNDLEPSIQWLENLKYPSGNFPSSVGSTTDKLVHWCHGAPSMTMLFALAYEIFKKEQYLATALQCGEVVWKRGLLKKGCGICHGVAGNAYSFLTLFHVTNDLKHLYRACKFAEWCIDYDTHQKKKADRPFSLFEGLAGTIYFLVDLQKPYDAKFPGYTV